MSNIFNLDVARRQTFELIIFDKRYKILQASLEDLAIITTLDDPVQGAKSRDVKNYIQFIAERINQATGEGAISQDIVGQLTMEQVGLILTIMSTGTGDPEEMQKKSRACWCYLRTHYTGTCYTILPQMFRAIPIILSRLYIKRGYAINTASIFVFV
jgi:hypothetical protein